jgi:hypothetical protein
VGDKGKELTGTLYIAVLGWMRYTLTSLQTSLLLLREALILTPLPLQGRGWGLGFSAVLHATEKCYIEIRAGFIHKIMRDARGLEKSCAPIARSFCGIV